MPKQEKPYIKFEESKEISNSVSLNNSIQESEDDELVVFIDAIHAMTTANFTTYTPKELRGDAEKRTGVHSWTYPYEKPVLTHHEQHNGEPIGRVIRADFKNKSSINGEPCNRLKVVVTDEDAIKKVQDGRYQTVSIGGRAEQAHCSICGQDVLNEGHCGHWPGNTYEEETCHVILGDISFVEVSFVNVPADSYAMIVSINDSKMQSKESNNKESIPYNLFESQNSQGGSKKMDLKEKYDKLEENYSLVLDKLAAKEELAENLEEKASRFEKEKEELSDQVKEQKSDISKKDETISQLQKDVKEMEEELVDLRSIKHEGLAEKIVKMKVDMGYFENTEEEFLEEMVEKYSARPSEVLECALEDLELEKELKESKPEDSTQKEVDNPGKHNSKESGVKDEEEEEEKEDDKAIAEKLKELNII